MKRLIKKFPHHFSVAVAGWASRLIVAPVQLLAIPIYFSKLGLNDFAIFTVITSMTPWYALVDFGIGQALQNNISEYRARSEDPVDVLNKAFPVIVAIMFGLAVVCILFGGFMAKWLFSNLQNPLSTLQFDVNLILYCWYSVLLVSGKIFFAYQRGFFGYFYQCIAYILLLVIIGIIYLFHIKLSLQLALFTWVLPLFLSSLAGFLHAFYAAGATFNLFHWDRKYIAELRSRAFQFWVVSISATGVIAIDYIVIVKLLSAGDIVTYNIIGKVFNMLFFAYGCVLSALWPTLAERYARRTVKDVDLAERDLQRTIMGGIVYMLVATFGILLFRNTIIDVFRVRQAIDLPVPLILLFGVYGCMHVLTGIYIVVLQSRNMNRIFMIMTPVQAMLATTLMLVLAKFHLYGILVSLILSYLLIPVWILPLYHQKNIRSMDLAPA